jgi:2-haloacid dehalogenase
LKNKQPAFIFDFGGVLIDWDPRYLYRKLFDGQSCDSNLQSCGSNLEAMERFLREVDFYQWNARQDEGRPFAEGVEELCGRFPQYSDLILAYDRRWDESIAGPIPGTLAILRALREMGYPLYGLSNWSVEKFQLVRHKYEMFGWFETILLSGEVKLTKPDPRIFEIMLERIGRVASECLLVDDSIGNVEAARQLGFQAIHFRSPEQLQDELTQRMLLTPDGIYGIIH